MKASHSFKLARMKLTREFKQLERKANISYLAAKNDILFRKFPN